MTAIVPPSLAGERLDRVVAMLTGLSRARATELIAAGAVHVDGRPETIRARRLAEGERVDVDRTAAAAEAVTVEADESVAFRVVHADEQVIVVDKPAGLVVHPWAGEAQPTLVAGLLAQFPDVDGVGQPGRPGIVHRLDAGTSGLLAVARTDADYDSLVAQLAERSVTRSYRALVGGHPAAAGGLVDAPVGRSARHRTRMAVTARGRDARTRYEVIARFDEPTPVALLACWLETGRTHQIRVHLAAIGHPVLGDERYGGLRPELAVGRPWLHAAELGFTHPTSGERLEFTADLPPDLTAVLDRLG
ncbi:RluA family pseudouridine synthase [soil metagenome]